MQRSNTSEETLSREDLEVIEAEEAELDRLAAILGKGPEMPEDLVELMWAIAERTFLRLAVPDAAPYQFGRFEALDTKFRQTSMVIKARDPQLDRKVAIEIWMCTEAEAEAALLTRAKALAKFSQRNTVTVYETGKWCDRVYFVRTWEEGDEQHWDAS